MDVLLERLNKLCSNRNVSISQSFLIFFFQKHEKKNPARQLSFALLHSSKLCCGRGAFFQALRCPRVSGDGVPFRRRNPCFRRFRSVSIHFL